MRVIRRFLGFILMMLAVAALVHDATAPARGEPFHLSALGYLWHALSPGSLGLTQTLVQHDLTPSLWDRGVATVLLWPAELVLGAPGLLLWLSARRPAPRKVRPTTY